MKKKINIADIILTASCGLAWIDIILLITYVHINHPVATVIRCLYFSVLAFYSYCLVTEGTDKAKREIKMHRILVRQQTELDFKNEYEAFRKEMHG